MQVNSLRFYSHCWDKKISNGLIAETKGENMGRGGLGLFLVAGLALLVPARAIATMDGSLASMGRDAARLSMETGGLSPCPLPKGMFSGVGRGEFPKDGIASLCMYGELVSYLHHTKIREYFRLLPPEKVFAVYWEGALDPGIFLGSAAAGLTRSREKKEWRTGRFLYIAHGTGTFVVDTTLLPPGLDPKLLSP